MFNETSSLATLEAVAAGCAVICTRAGALQESARGNILITPRSNPVSFINAFIAWAVRLLKDDNLFNSISERNQKYAIMHEWQQIAYEWKLMLGL